MRNGSGYKDSVMTAALNNVMEEKPRFGPRKKKSAPVPAEKPKEEKTLYYSKPVWVAKN